MTPRVYIWEGNALEHLGKPRLSGKDLGRCHLDELLGSHLCRALGELAESLEEQWHCRPKFRSAMTAGEKPHPSEDTTGHQKSQHSGPKPRSSWLDGQENLLNSLQWAQGARRAGTGNGGGKKCRTYQKPGKGPGSLISKARGQEKKLVV